MELSSRGRAPWSTGFPRYVGVLGTRLCQSTSWPCCEQLHWTSVIFSLKTPSTGLPSSWRVIHELTCPHHAGCSAVVDQTSMTPVSHPPYSHDLAPRDFFFCFPGWKKGLRGKHFANAEEVKPKTAEALKGIQIDEFKTVLSSGKNISIGVLHPVQSTLKVTEA